jgi:signal transduction histidine kinase
MSKIVKHEVPYVENSGLQFALEKQRADIASVVHDEICATLTVLLHDFYWIEKTSKANAIKSRANKCIDQLTNTMNSCRSVLMDLRPNEAGPSLTDSLACLIGNFKISSELHVSSEIGSDINQLTINQQSVVYRSVQEALTNITKHSQAKQVHVIAKIILRQMHVQVIDDGVGLVGGSLFPSFCFGLKLQKQRTEELGGHFSIQNNSNGMGTKLHLTFPLATALRQE